MLVEQGKKRNRYFIPDPPPRGRRLLPLRPFPLLQAGRSGDQLPVRQRSGRGRDRAGQCPVGDYTAKRYHQADDEWQPDWNYAGMVEDARMLHDLGRSLANSTLWPNWSSDSEFRAARDASAAERGEPESGPAPAAQPEEPGERG